MRRIFAGLLVVLILTSVVRALDIDELAIAAERGDVQAQCNLGVMYGRGVDVAPDDNEAIRWISMAAERGSAKAQFNLGLLYMWGDGVIQDDNEAMKWIRRAAEQGYAKAQFNLGLMCSLGKGVPRNDAKAYFWLNLSASSDAKYSQGRDEAASKLTPAQIEEIKARCAKWLEDYGKRKNRRG